MSDERLHFDGSAATTPDAMYAAEHFARYAVLAPIVCGKRVLDIACGEGYGSWFLKEWGAREVVGVDISADAIDAAKNRFSREGVSFLVGDACRAQDFLEHASFDLIVSFETIEHVADPLVFLAGLRSLASPGAGIFISCPNDHIVMPADQSNPFHLRKYTFKEFQNLSESILGKGTQWLLGANVQGYALIPDGDPVISNAWEDWHDIVNAKSFGVSHLLPSQTNIRPDRSNVLYYLGVWGMEKPVAAVAISAQSYPAFIGPWKTIEWFKAQLSQTTIELEEANQRCATPSSFIELRETIEWLKAQLPQATIGLEVANQSCSTPRLEIQQLCSRFSREVAENRHRVLALATQIMKLEEEKRNLQATAERVSSLEADVLNRDYQLSMILNSKSWRWTKVLRVIGRLMRGEFRIVKESFLARIANRRNGKCGK